MVLGKTIDDKTAIVIDEIQQSERAITSLKYFCEAKENYRIICAGRLLGVKVKRFESYYFVMNSDPRKKDTDEDGILDHDDPLKLTYGISNCMSNDYKEELFSEIDQIIKDDFSWIMENKNIGYYSTRDCIDILYEYDDLITDLSNGYLLPKAAIQTMFALFGTFSIT